MSDKADKSSVHSGHRKRVKDKFLNFGIDTFEDHVILEMLLYYCIPRTDTNPIAHALLNKFGSIDRVFDAPYEELISVEGIGESAAILIKFIPQLSRKYNEAKLIKKGRIYSSQQISEMLKAKFIGVDNEQIMLILLGSDATLLYCGVVNEGSLNTVPVYVRKIANLALKYNADCAIVAHNHPSGNAMPSPQDISATREILNALDSINIYLDDHIIIAKDEYTSMKASGWLDRIRDDSNSKNEPSLSEVELYIEAQRKEIQKQKQAQKKHGNSAASPDKKDKNK